MSQRMKILSKEKLFRIYPPRAEYAVRPNRLTKLKDYIVQFKYDDVRTLIYVFPGGEIEFRTRKQERHKGYQLSARMKKSLLRLNLSSEKSHILDGGIMRHIKVLGERPIVLWDILFYDNRSLIGTTYPDRYRLLKEICHNPKRFEKTTGQQIALDVSGVLWLAPNFKDARAAFKRSLECDDLEGVLLKKSNAPLKPGLRERNNLEWQLKSRKPHKLYPF